MSLEVEHLSKSFGRKQVLKEVSFGLGENEVVGLVGPSGCGKSTIVKVILGLLSADAGKITVNGKPSTFETIRRVVGYVAQQDSFYPYLSVQENLDYFASLYGTTSPVKPEVFGLEPTAVAGALSGGQKKRLSILCALSHRPKFLFLDEPTVGLDPISKEQILGLIKRLKKISSVIFITHHLKEVEEVCDKVVVLGKGDVLFEGKPTELLRKTKAKNLEEAFVGLVKKI